jgi:hypothetical protein
MASPDISSLSGCKAQIRVTTAFSSKNAGALQHQNSSHGCIYFAVNEQKQRASHLQEILVFPAYMGKIPVVQEESGSSQKIQIDWSGHRNQCTRNNNDSL